MYGRNQHNIVIILQLKIIKRKKRKKEPTKCFSHHRKMPKPPNYMTLFPQRACPLCSGCAGPGVLTPADCLGRKPWEPGSCSEKMRPGVFLTQTESVKWKNITVTAGSSLCYAENPKAPGITGEWAGPGLLMVAATPAVRSWDCRLAAIFFFLNVRPHSTTCRTLVPRPRIEPTLPALEGRVLTTGPLGKSRNHHFLSLTGNEEAWVPVPVLLPSDFGRSFLLSGSFLIFKASRLLGHFLGLLWETHHVGSQYYTGLAIRPLWIQPALDSIPALYLWAVWCWASHFTFLSLCKPGETLPIWHHCGIR